MEPELIAHCFFVTFIVVYLLSHLPLDILMLLHKGKAKYPSPDFSSFTEAFLVVGPTITLWLLLFIGPLTFFVTKKDILGLHFFPSSMEWASRILGIVLMSIALILEAFGRIARGTYLSKNEAELVTKYSYAIIRHPQYVMYILCFIGFPLASLNPFLFALMIGIKGYYSLAIREEEELMKVFGDTYKQYIERVGRFIPKFYHQKKSN